MLKTKKSIYLGGRSEERVFIFTVPAVVGAIGAISSLASGPSAIANSVNKKKAEYKKKIQDMKRHNKAMERKVFFRKKGGRDYI